MHLASRFQAKLADLNRCEVFGRVVKVVGLTIESAGPKVRLGDICRIGTADAGCLAEVVGFRESRVVLMPLGELNAVEQGADVQALHIPLRAPVGEALLGRVLDGLGRPMDGGTPLHDVGWRDVDASPPNPMLRVPIHEVIETGVRSLDGLLTVGKGQRMGIFAGSGVGKSTLMGMIAKHTGADVNVIALVGERGREVREFIERDLGADGLKRSVLVISTSDQPPLIRLKAAFVATAIAESFRDAGKHVTLMMDSVTRFAMAQREIGLAVGEPPTSRGYTPSVFALLPRLLERAGAGSVGTITAFYTVLVDGDDLNDPIADAVRGILDGHLVLSRRLANAGRFPAVDVLASISRLFSTVASPAQQQAARVIRGWLQRYSEVEDLIRIGAYQPGLDPETDQAIAKFPEVRRFLEQETADLSPFAQTLDELLTVAGMAG